MTSLITEAIVMSCEAFIYLSYIGGDIFRTLERIDSNLTMEPWYKFIVYWYNNNFQMYVKVVIDYINIMKATCLCLDCLQVFFRLTSLQVIKKKLL